MDTQTFLDNFETIAEAPGSVDRLRESILDLAVHGRLVNQLSEEGSAGTFLQGVRETKRRMIDRGEASKPRTLSEESAGPDLFELPKTWTWVILDDIAAYVQRGKGPKYVDRSAVPVISQKCVQSAGFDISRARYVEEQSLEKYGNERFLQPGDLLWNSTGTGTVGRVNVFPGTDRFERAVADSHVTVIRLAGSMPEYLHCWLAGPIVQSTINDRTTGTTKQQELNLSTIRLQTVPLPPRAEQERIVAKVNELMQLCDDLETSQETRQKLTIRLRASALAALTNAETATDLQTAWSRIHTNWETLTDTPESVENMQSAILDLAVQGLLVEQRAGASPVAGPLAEVASIRRKLETQGVLRRQSVAPESPGPRSLPAGWAWATPDQLCDNVPYALSIGPFGSNLLKADYRSEGVPLVFVREIRRELFGDGDTKFVSVTKAAELSSHIVAGGDLLVTKMGAPPGDTAIYPKTRPTAVITADCIKFKPHPAAVTAEYLKFCYRAPSVRASIAEITMGVAHQKMSLKRFRSTPIPIPPLEEQARIVDRLTELAHMARALSDCLDVRTQSAESLGNALCRRVTATQALREDSMI